MKSRFGGWCKLHDRSHSYPEGTEIEKSDSGATWAPVACIVERRRLTDLVNKVEAAAAEKNLYLGIFGFPAGGHGTFSRAEFLSRAVELGACSELDAMALQQFWRSILHRDLSD